MNLKLKALTAIVGTLIEWADYVLYAYMAHIVADIFFAPDPTVNMLATFGAMGVGFLARPLGGLFFGHLSDTTSRSASLALSIFVMAGASLGIALTPGYSQIGLLAPVLLIFFRLAQGFAVGGEYNNAGIYLSELFKDNPVFAGSLNAAAAAMGIVVGASISFMVSASSAPTQSFRIAFACSAIAGVLGYFLRRGHANENKAKRVPSLGFVFRQYRGQIAMVFALAAFVGTFVYVANLYYVTYLQQAVGLARLDAMKLAIFGEFLVAIATPLVAWLYRGEPSRLLYSGMIACISVTPLMFMVNFNTTWEYLVALQVMFAIADAMLCAPMFAIMNSWLPENVRARAISIGWGCGIAFWAGMAPTAAQYLAQSGLGSHIWLLVLTSGVLVALTHRPAVRRFIYV